MLVIYNEMLCFSLLWVSACMRIDMIWPWCQRGRALRNQKNWRGVRMISSNRACDVWPKPGYDSNRQFGPKHHKWHWFSLQLYYKFDTFTVLNLMRCRIKSSFSHQLTAHTHNIWAKTEIQTEEIPDKAMAGLKKQKKQTYQQSNPLSQSHEDMNFDRLR